MKKELISGAENYFNPKRSGWSKTDSKGNPGLSVFEHCRHIGWVALELIHQGQTIPHTELTPLVAAIMAAMHDVGKWSSGFQNMCSAWLEQEGLTLVAKRWAWEAQQGIRHEKISQDSIQLLLQTRGFKQSETIAWAMVAGAHHGKMHLSEKYGRGDLSSFIDEWHHQRHQIIDALESEFSIDIPGIGIKKTDAVIPWLMGLTSVVDWIGSDEIHFPVDKGLDEIAGKESAKLAVESIGLCRPQITKNLEFEEIFGFSANDMQQKALSVGVSGWVGKPVSQAHRFLRVFLQTSVKCVIPRSMVNH